MTPSPGRSVAIRRALERFQQSNGTKCPPIGGQIESLEDVTMALRRVGLVAEPRRMDPRTVTNLPRGTVVTSLTGELGVLVRTAPSALTVDFGDSERSVPSNEVHRHISPSIVLWRMPDTSNVPLWRVLRAVLADDRVPRSLLALGGTSVLVTLASVAMPLVTRRMVGHAIQNWAPLELALLALSTIILSGHVFWLNLMRRRWFAFLEATTEQAIVREVIRRMLNQDLRAIETSAADLPMLLVQARAVGAALPALLSIAIDTVLGSLFLIALAWIDRSAALAVLGISAVTFVASFLLGSRFRRVQRELMERMKSQTRLLHDVIAGCEAIKANVAERGMVEAWRRRLMDENVSGVRLRTTSAIRGAIHALADRWTFAAVVLTGGLAALHGTRQPGDIIATLQAATGWGAVLSATTALPMLLSVGRDLFARLSDLGAPPPGPLQKSDVTPGVPLVHVEGLAFRYSADTPWVLTDLSLSIASGDRVLIRWPSGKGKTTLMRLLSGLLVPDGGRVLIEGRPAHERAIPVAYLPQSSSLLPLTMRENLRLFSCGASPERIERAMAETGLADVVAKLPMGQDTVLTAGSRTLSSGQAHLVLLSAVLASESRLLLLDEAFAHLDARLQARILNCELLKERTVVLVTHESSTAFGAGWKEIQ